MGRDTDLMQETGGLVTISREADRDARFCFTSGLLCWRMSLTRGTQIRGLGVDPVYFLRFWKGDDQLN